jgi:hypothetical protein
MSALVLPRGMDRISAWESGNWICGSDFCSIVWLLCVLGQIFFFRIPERELKSYYLLREPER